MSVAFDEAVLQEIFLSARTHIAWLNKPVPEESLVQIVDLMKLGPTSANCSPARIVFVRSPQAKKRLKPFLSSGNRDKAMKAPATVIIGYDLEFYEKLPTLFPHTMLGPGLRGGRSTSRRRRFATARCRAPISSRPHALSGARLRPDVRLRSGGRHTRVFRRHADQSPTFSAISDTACSRTEAARAASRVRRVGEDHLTA